MKTARFRLLNLLSVLLSQHPLQFQTNDFLLPIALWDVNWKFLSELGYVIDWTVTEEKKGVA